MCEIKYSRQYRQDTSHFLLEKNGQKITDVLMGVDFSEIGLKWLENVHNLRHENDKTKKIPIEEATLYLYVHFRNIKSVEEWADGMGYSREYFWRKFYSEFGIPPKEAFIERKKRVLINFLKKNQTCKSMEAAKIIHLADGNSLLQFVKKHFGCRPTDLKVRIRKNSF